jgi:hypothetical protein
MAVSSVGNSQPLVRGKLRSLDVAQWNPGSFGRSIGFWITRSIWFFSATLRLAVFPETDYRYLRRYHHSNARFIQ